MGVFFKGMLVGICHGGLAIYKYVDKYIIYEIVG